MKSFTEIMSKEQINSRVLTAVSIVLDTHKELTKTAIAQLLGIKPSTFTEILKGRMNASSELMALLTSNYGVSATWLLVGTGEMFISEEQETHSNSSAEPMVDKLLGIIQQQAEDIGQLRSELAQLKQRLQKSADAASTERIANVG